MPWDGAVVEVARARWRPSRLTVEGLVARLADQQQLRVDTAVVDYSLFEVFADPRRIRRVRLVGVALDVREDAKGWPWSRDWQRPAAASGGSRGLLIEALELDQVSARALQRDGAVLFSGRSRGPTVLSSVRIDSTTTLPSVQDARSTVDVALPAWVTGMLHVSGQLQVMSDLVQVRAFTLTDSLGGQLTVGGAYDAGKHLGAHSRTQATDSTLRLSGTNLSPARLVPALSAVIDTALRVSLQGHVRQMPTGARLDATITSGRQGAMHVELRADSTDSTRVALAARFDRLMAGHWFVGLPVSDAVDGTLRATFNARDPLNGAASMAASLRSRLDSVPVELELAGETRQRVAHVVTLVRWREQELRTTGDVFLPADADRDSLRWALTTRVRGRARAFMTSAPDVVNTMFPTWSDGYTGEGAWRGVWHPKATQGAQPPRLQSTLTLRATGIGDGPAALRPTQWQVDASWRERYAPSGARGAPRAPSDGVEAHITVNGADGRLQGTLTTASLMSGNGTRWSLGPVAFQRVQLLTAVNDSARAFGTFTLLPAPGVRPTVLRLHVDSLFGGQYAGTRGQADLLFYESYMDARGQLEQDGARVVVDSLRVERETLTALQAQVSQLDVARYVAGVRPMQVTGTVRITSGRDCRGVRCLLARIDSARMVGAGSAVRVLTGELQATDVSADSAVAVRLALQPRGTASWLDLRASVQRDTLGALNAIHAERARMDAFDPSWLVDGAPSAPIFGTLRGDIRRDTTGAWQTSAGTFTLDSARAGGIAVHAVDGTWSASSEQVRWTTAGRAPAAHWRFDGSAQHRGNAAWNGQSTLALRDSAAADTTFQATVRWEPSTRVARDVLTHVIALDGHGTIGRVQLDTAHLRGTLSDGRFAATRLQLRGPGIDVRGWDALTKASNSRTLVQGTVQDVQPLFALIGVPDILGQLSLDVREVADASSRDQGDVHDVRIAMRHAAISGVRVDSAILQSRVYQADISNLPDRVVSQLRLRRDRGVVLLVPGGSTLALGTRQPPDRVDVDVTWMRAEPDAIVLRTLSMPLDGATWRLRQPALVRWSPTLRVDSLNFGTAPNGPRVTWVDGPRRTMRVQSLPLLYTTPTGVLVPRVLDLALDMAPADTRGAQASTVLGQVEAKLVHATDSLEYQTVSSQWTATSSSFTAQAVQAKGGRISVEAEWSLDADSATTAAASTRPIVGRFIASRFDLSSISAANTDSLANLRGVLDGDVQLSGTSDAPRFAGALNLRQFQLASPMLGVRWLAEQLAFRFDGTTLRVEQATITDPHRGTATVSGTVSLQELTRPAFDLRSQFTRFELLRNSTGHAVVTGAVTLTGSQSAPVLGGTLDVEQGTYYLNTEEVPRGVADMELTADDYAELEELWGLDRVVPQRGANLTPWNALAMQLRVRASSDVWIRRTIDPALQAEVSGTLTLSKRAREDTRIEGELTVGDNGTINQFGRRFAISTGRVRFNGLPADVEVTGRAIYEINDVSIHVDARGDSAGLSVTLGSEPAMSEADIISYLAVGHDATSDRAFGGGMDDAYGLGMNVALSRVAQRVEELARSRFGLDVVEIRQNGITGLNLVGGRNVTRRLFVGFQQPVGFSQSENGILGTSRTELQARYRLNEWLLANLSGGRSVLRTFLVARHVY